MDPVYYERSYYIGPDKGGDRAFALLSEAMQQMELVALARYATRGKDYLVLLRPLEGLMVMHQLYHSDEIRPASEVPAARRGAGEGELRLARQLVEQITARGFEPERYEDEVRKRVRKLIQQKVQGKDITEGRPRPARGEKVVDLMEALKASLGRQGRQRAPLAAHRARGHATTRPRTAKARRKAS